MMEKKAPWADFRDRIRRTIEQHWYDGEPSQVGHAWNKVFSSAINTRRRWLNKLADGPLPVIVVGNIVVGGTGKTPLVIELIHRLKTWGKRPGVVSRGYGARLDNPPVCVTSASNADEVGDEPLLIASLTHVPVVVDPDRSRALKYLASHHDVDIVLSDDGLQHYQLERCFEIAVVDGVRGFGNGQCIPFGPLREPISRLQEVDMVVVNGGVSLNIGRQIYRSTIRPTGFRSLQTGQAYNLSEWPKRTNQLVAVAGIGRPEGFFETLRDMGCEVTERPYSDHYRFSDSDFEDLQHQTVVVTAKDAVKIHPSWLKDGWVLDVQFALDESFWHHLKVQLQSIGVVQADQFTSLNA